MSESCSVAEMSNSSAEDRKQKGTSMKSKNIPLLIVTVGIVASTSFRSLPAALAVGDIPITGTTEAAQPGLAGTILEEAFTRYDFSGSVEHLTGQIQSRVVRSSLTGTLDFYWRIIPDATSTGDIYGVRLSAFAGVFLDANWRSDDLGNVAPQIARNFGSGFINYLFSPGIGPGVGPNDSSRFFFLSTDATAYNLGGFYDLLSAPSDAVSSQFATFAPVPVPEPSTAGLAALGILGFLGSRFSVRRIKRV